MEKAYFSIHFPHNWTVFHLSSPLFLSSSLSPVVWVRSVSFRRTVTFPVTRHSSSPTLSTDTLLMFVSLHWRLWWTIQEVGHLSQECYHHKHSCEAHWSSSQAPGDQHYWIFCISVIVDVMGILKPVKANIYICLCKHRNTVFVLPQFYRVHSSIYIFRILRMFFIVTRPCIYVCYVCVSCVHDICFCPAVERSSVELQWLLNMVQNDPAHYVRSANNQHVFARSTHTHSVNTKPCCTLHSVLTFPQRLNGSLNVE